MNYDLCVRYDLFFWYLKFLIENRESILKPVERKRRRFQYSRKIILDRRVFLQKYRFWKKNKNPVYVGMLLTKYNCSGEPIWFFIRMYEIENRGSILKITETPVKKTVIIHNPERLHIDGFFLQKYRYP